MVYDVHQESCKKIYMYHSNDAENSDLHHRNKLHNKIILQ